MLRPPLVFDFPALPLLCRLHALIATGIEAFGPLLGRGRAKAQRVVELFRDVLDVFPVVVLCDVDAGRGSCGLKRVRRDVVVVVGDEGIG